MTEYTLKTITPGATPEQVVAEARIAMSTLDAWLADLEARLIGQSCYCAGDLCTIMKVGVALGPSGYEVQMVTQRANGIQHVRPLGFGVLLKGPLK